MVEKEHLIDLQHICKDFDGTTVLQDINLYIRKKEFVTLLGPSGCGKTTTLRIIGGFEYPSSGTLLFEGKDIESMQEMLLRIRALLRRANIVSEHKLQIGEVTLDYDSLTVTRGNDTQTLPKKEFYLLYKLLSYPNKIFTRIQLMDEIWGMESESGDSTVNVHINRLRRRFENDPEFELVSVRGLGYKAVKKV